MCYFQKLDFVKSSLSSDAQNTMSSQKVTNKSIGEPADMSNPKPVQKRNRSFGIPDDGELSEVYISNLFVLSILFF